MRWKKNTSRINGIDGKRNIFVGAEIPQLRKKAGLEGK